MKHKRFNYRCPQCEQTGLQVDPDAVYKVRVCDACEGRGKARLTVMERIELDRGLRGGAKPMQEFRMPTFDQEGPRDEPAVQSMKGLKDGNATDALITDRRNRKAAGNVTTPQRGRVAASPVCQPATPHSVLGGRDGTVRRQRAARVLPGA